MTSARKCSKTSHYRRGGRAGVTVLLVIVALGAGAVGGYWASTQFSALVADTGGTDGGVDDSERLYSCGMHPNVLQKGPGDCPICQMKLTPLKMDEDESGPVGGPQERKVVFWRAPMDPNYISQKPGKSPMGMDLVPVYADKDDSPSSHNIRIDPVTIQNMGLRTAVVKRGALVKTVRTVGRVDYDEQRVSFVDTKFNGWIEELYIDETGMPVKKGERLFDVYSPELYAAQVEYLAAVRNLPLLEESTFPTARVQAGQLVEAAETKLRYLDVLDEQIQALRTSGEIAKTLTIHSPATGIVTEKMVLDGMYVKPGMRLYTIADLSRVWVYVDVYEYQLPWVSNGQPAKMTLPYVPGEEFDGKVVYIYPYLDPKTRVIQVRLEFENPGLQLKPGMYANVKLESQLQRDATLIPREAYIDSGTRKVVFVDRGGGKFTPRDIQVGVEAEDGMVEVLDGLDPGEVVVSSGQFMLDAESKLKEAVAKMLEAERSETTKREERTEPGEMDQGMMAAMPVMPSGAAYACPMEKHPDQSDPDNRGPYFSAEPGKCPRCGMKLKPLDGLAWTAAYHGDHAGSTTSGTSPVGIPDDALFACPMEEHPDEADSADQGPYFAAEPGECPRCGMKVKPLDELEWVRLRRAAKGGDVAYTCPDHQHVFSDKSGECPRCGKELVPFKVMYSCPDPEHSGEVSASSGNCPECGRGMAAFRGVWLDESMAKGNVPLEPGLADAASYRCAVHPLVHSDKPGNCTICGAPMESVTSSGAQPQEKRIPADAKFTCPMKECWYFATEEGKCPTCGMRLKPIKEVDWAKDLKVAPGTVDGDAKYICPMHPNDIRESHSGECPICGMALVRQEEFRLPQDAPARIAAQMDYIIEHYLEIQRLLASDRTADVARHALGLASASEALIAQVDDPSAAWPAEVKTAASDLHAAALKTTGASLNGDRVTFVTLSAAVQTLIRHARPDRKRWPKLYVFHCPMSKGDWLQTSKDKSNPYYGFKMLTCGELKGVE